MQDGSHPHPPEIDREMRPRGCPIQDFMDFLYYRSTGKCEKGFVKLFSWTVFFFPACYACACETNDLQNSSNSFLVSSHPFSRLKKKKEERKKKKRKEWKELCYERKTCRLGAEELRINVGVNEKRSKIFIRRWRWHSKSARNTWTESQNSLAYQLGTLATRYDKMPLRDATFLDRSTETNVFSMNFNQEITISVVWAKRKKNK